MTTPLLPSNEALLSQLMHGLMILEKQLQGNTKTDFGRLYLTLSGKSKRLVTPSKTVNASGEEQVEDISPTTLEAAAILTKVKKIKSVDRGKRYKRRKSSKVSAGTGLDFEEVNDPVTTDSIRVSVPSPDRGRREGKAPMTEEEEAQSSISLKELSLQEEARTLKFDRDLCGQSSKTKTAKKLKFDDESTQPTEEQGFERRHTDDRHQETGREKKPILKERRLHTDLDKDDSEDSNEASKKDDSTSGTKIPINPVPVAIKSPSIANYKIIKQGRKGVYQIVRENGTDMANYRIRDEKHESDNSYLIDDLKEYLGIDSELSIDIHSHVSYIVDLDLVKLCTLLLDRLVAPFESRFDGVGTSSTLLC
ncbi:hypothetical protein Tco_0014415 [Tanacetum coccineum]